IKYERCRRWVVSLLFCLLPIVVASPIIAWQTRADLNHHMQNVLVKGTDYINLLLRNAHVANERAAPYLNMDCLDATRYLRELVATTPDIRTINLAKQNTIYCNSLTGQVNDHYQIDSYVSGELYLMAGNRLTPLRPVLAFHRTYEQGMVITGVSSYYLTNMLILLDGYGKLYFHVGKNHLDETGVVTSEPLFPTIINTSERYPYSLSTLLTIDDYWLYF
ncbi:cyclic diguanylate phosphodiesterase, partial [Vibrio anguillarum]